MFSIFTVRQAMAMTRKQKMAEFEQGYNIAVTGRHVHVTNAMKTYAEEKLARLERFGDRIIDILVTMDIQKLVHKVDIVLKYGHTLVKSQASSTDMYVSIDMAIDKLEAQLEKYKSRLREHHAKAYPVIDIPVTIYGATKAYPVVDIPEPVYGIPEAPTPKGDAIDLMEFNSEIEEETERQREKSFQLHEIVRVESQPLKILTDNEAIMKMELSGAPVMVYRSEISRKLKVIYRLEDGNFGIIEPE
jgi:putative sigma-54 modulation protein